MAGPTSPHLVIPLMFWYLKKKLLLILQIVVLTLDFLLGGNHLHPIAFQQSKFHMIIVL